MPSWALKLATFMATVLVLGGSLDYAAGHLKNPAAPLQPPVAGAAAATPSPAGSALPRASASAGGSRRPTPAGTPLPALTIQPGVRTASLAPLTFTHVS